MVTTGKPRAIADCAEGSILASVDLAARPERVFQALASSEITQWWVRSGVFDTREWSGEVRNQGRWSASGMARGQPYALEGEFVEVDPPHRLVHTWKGVGAPGEPTTVTYRLEPIEGGTRLKLRHAGFTSPEQCTNTAVGWETSLERLAELLS